MALQRIVLGLAFVVFAASCSHKTPAPETPPAEGTQPVGEPQPPIEPTPAPGQQASVNLPYTYDGEKGPENWASLNPEYAACGKGKNQSPLNLTWKKPSTKQARLDFSYNTSTAMVDTSTGFLNLKMTGANQLLMNGKVYALERIDFHSPSEHQLSKTSLTMEMQLVHKAVEGNKMAVVSVFAVEGKDNPLFSEIWAQLNNPQTPFQLDPARMIPPTRTHYRYSGSLTTPPCTEGVEWVVFNTPMELSKEQITAYRAKFTPNARPVQKQGSRKVTNY